MTSGSAASGSMPLTPLKSTSKVRELLADALKVAYAGEYMAAPGLVAAET